MILIDTFPCYRIAMSYMIHIITHYLAVPTTKDLIFWEKHLVRSDRQMNWCTLIHYSFRRFINVRIYYTLFIPKKKGEVGSQLI